MKTCKTLAALAAACLAVSVHAADTLPAGILITGQVSGAASQLLGLDHLFDNPLMGGEQFVDAIARGLDEIARELHQASAV